MDTRACTCAEPRRSPQERYEKRGERNTQTNLFYAQVIKRLIYSINVSIDKADLSHLYYTLSHAGDD